MTTQSTNNHIEVEDIGDVSVVHFVGKWLLDPNGIQVTSLELFRLVDERGGRHVVLDLANVDYVSSFALGKFITLYKKLKTVGGRLVIRNINAPIRELFKLSDLPWETGDSAKQSEREPALAADLPG